MKKHKKLLLTVVIVLVIVVSGLGVGLGHELFTTLPSALALSSHTDKAPLMVAHRGLSSLYPENSLPALEGAAEYGFDGYEFDVHTTKDGKWVVIHDDTVDNMTAESGDVESFTFEEIRKMKLDNGNGIEKYPDEKIPTLEEALEICKSSGIIPVIEIKKCDVQYLPSFMEILERYGVKDKAVIISFTREYLEKYRELDKKAEIMLLKGTPEKDDVDWCVEYSAGLDFGYYNVYKCSDVLSYAREKGVKLGAWTVDNTAYMDVMVMLGAEIITTNKILP